MQNSSYNSDLDVDYVGRVKPLFWLATRTLFLTVLTLGIYRFWMKTRIRQYYWSSVQPGGVPMEYTGTGLEKLLGFLIAVVFLAIYLGLVNLALSFVGLAFFQGNPLALNISFFAAIPLIYYAQYRGRRYILSRTRWRGVRFGADKAAVSYMLAALGHTFLSIITLGLLVPRQTFKLEKFVTDRTWYGDIKFKQHGDWKMLFKPWLAVVGAIALTVGVLTFAIVGQNEMLVFAILPGYFLIAIAAVYYSVASFRLLANNKTAGSAIKFASTVRTGKILAIYVMGVIAIFASTLLILFVLLVLMALLAGAFSSGYSLDNLAGFGGVLEYLIASSPWLVAFPVVAYFALLLLIGALSHVFFIQPVLRHYARNMMLFDADELDRVSQRPHDDNVEAEGFADALDVGAAI